MSDLDPARQFRHDVAGALTPLLVEVQLLLSGEAKMDAEVREAVQDIEKLALRLRDIVKSASRAGEASTAPGTD
jgi:hypothetical protein